MLYFFIFTTIGLTFFCVCLFSAVKRLKEQIIGLQLENKMILERKVMKTQDEDSVSMKSISEEVSPKPLPRTKNVSSQPKSVVSKPKVVLANHPSPKGAVSERNSNSVKNSTMISNGSPNQKDFINSREKKVTTKNNSTRESLESPIQRRNTEPVKSASKVYQGSDVLSHNKMTSPVSISNDTLPTNQEPFDMSKLSLDLNEFIKKSEKIVPLIQSQQKRDYLKEISDKMANDLKPQTIELTDYEKEQEERAIISYQELLSVKDQLIVLDDEEETEDFIEDLKNFRNRLDS